MEMSYGSGPDKGSDSALVIATRHGDMQAFEELVLRHKQRVLSAAQRITNNREDAEDVAQECFHKAFVHLDSFQEKSRFSTWLTRIAMNEAFMLLRRKRRVFEPLPENPENIAKSSLEPFVDRSPDPEESCWRREHKQLLTRAINRLRPKVRHTILLLDIEQRSVKETAHILGISTSAVKARVLQGRRRLRQTVNLALLIGVCSPDRNAAQPL